ncbi:TetR/AcrR family transcriptional regulator [Actinocorallia libanotica]|uniref:TetR family transcriptional regulator n=1 Tax=Actinocorallia libanotica TaxID=46162 RepID=A0ABN1RPE1_9ACTN
MMGTVRGTREIARAAVKAELAEVAFDLFRRNGYDQVTVNDVAAAAGVSRSTFLRYFGSKEDAVLSVLDAQGRQLAEKLRARPAGEDDWTALRRSFDFILEDYRENPSGTLALTRLVQQTPALRARRMEKHSGWRPGLAQALADRAGLPDPPPLAPLVRAAAALDCLSLAIDRWTSSDGSLDLAALLDEAFAALTDR